MAVKKEKAARGGTIVCSYPRDDSSHKVPKPMGYELGGSPTNLAHSLGDASAHQDGTGHNKKNKFD